MWQCLGTNWSPGSGCLGKMERSTSTGSKLPPGSTSLCTPASVSYYQLDSCYAGEENFHQCCIKNHAWRLFFRQLCTVIKRLAGRNKTIGLSLNLTTLCTSFKDLPNRYIDSVLWLKSLGHFIKHAPPERPLLLVVDQVEPLKNREAIRFCKENMVALVCLLASTTPVMQVLDVLFFFCPLKRSLTYFIGYRIS